MMIAALLLMQVSTPAIDALEKWEQCLLQEREHFKDSREPVGVIVDAIMGGCYPEDSKLARELGAALPSSLRPNLRAESIDREMAETRRMWRLTLTNFLVDRRMRQSKAGL